MRAWQLPGLAPLRRILSQQRRLLEPGLQQGSVQLLPSDPEQLDAPLAAGLPERSAKELFFPEHEPLFRFDGERFTQLLPAAEPRAVLGLRACDLTAIAYMDRFFADDAHYRARREDTLLVGLDCTLACDGGFCPLTGSGPGVHADHADMILHPREGAEGWLLLATSARGAELAATLQLQPAAPDWQQHRSSALAQAEEALRSRPGLAPGMARVVGQAVSAAQWEALGLRCIACSGCVQVCPSCSCFGVADGPGESAGSLERERFWDACLYEGFQREAGGYHPTPSPGQRLERFVRHKLAPEFADEAGRPTCVGCGRCDSICPSGVGLPSVLRELAP